MSPWASFQGPSLTVYNPDLLSDHDLRELFVARLDLLKHLREDLRQEGAHQHHLLLGQRGMGKTTLLRRLAVALREEEDLSRRWLPQVFPEEQYNVATLADLWTNCLDALSDALERAGDHEAARRNDALIDALPQEDEEVRAAAALAALTDWAERERGLVLLVDNMDQLFGRLEREQWALREVLSQHERLVFIAAAVLAAEVIGSYGAAFYDFFCPHELGGLDPEEAQAVLRKLAAVHGHARVSRLLDEQPARFRTLHGLTGGNPRTLVLLYQVLAVEDSDSVYVDLERLLDLSTPLYKARFEALAPQAQKITAALAVGWDPMTAAEVAAATHLDVNAVSSQLSRLEKLGVVEKVPLGPRLGFQVGERFFNIWYLMRASRSVRRKLLWLVRFLEVFFGREGLEERAGSATCNALAWTLFLLDQDLDEAETHAREAVRLTPEDPNPAHTLACILARRGVWLGAFAEARRYLTLGDEEYQQQIWPDTLRFFRLCIQGGKSAEAVALLEETGMAERWRPLHAALRAVAKSDPDALTAVAPEVRMPARALLDELWPPAERPAPAGRKRTRPR